MITCKLLVTNINSRERQEIRFDALSHDVALVTAKAILWDRHISGRTHGIELHVWCSEVDKWKESILHGEYHNPQPRLYEIRE